VGLSLILRTKEAVAQTATGNISAKREQTIAVNVLHVADESGKKTRLAIARSAGVILIAIGARAMVFV
jgi:hypothetical protein